MFQRASDLIKGNKQEGWNGLWKGKELVSEGGREGGSMSVSSIVVGRRAY